MKILRIIYDWPPPWSGLAAHPYELSVSQAKLGHKIDVFCGRWPKAGAIETYPGITTHAFWREPFKGMVFFTTSLCAFFYYFYWRFKPNGNKPDLIHSHGHFGVWLHLYFFLLRKFFRFLPDAKIPFVGHFHNTVAGRKQKLLEKGEKITPISKYIIWPLSEFSDRLLVKFADALIFVGEETKEEALKFYSVDATKCFVVESGVNSDIFRRVRLEERDKTRFDLKIEPHEKVILNHGTMVERKNIHLLVEALKYLPDNYKLFLAGPFGSSDYEVKINDIIQNNHLKGRVIFAGYIPYPEVPIAYQASDLFVLPSSFEGVPKVVMQGLACGIPCLVSGFKLSEDVSGLEYLDEITPEKIAQNILRMIGSPPKVDVDFVIREYSWDLRAKKVEEIYANLLPH